MSRASLPRPFSCPDRALKRCRPPGLPDRKTATSCACALFAHPGRGHRPCHSVPPGSGPARGPKSPASARPAPGGRFSLAGSGVGLPLVRAAPVFVEASRAGGGNAGRVSPARTDERTVTAAMAGAIAPATAQRRYQDQPGAQSPRPAPAPPLAGASRPPGRALASVSPGTAGLQGNVPHGRGKRGSRFLIPPALTKALSPLQWQGPSPLPQCNAVIRTSRGPRPPASTRPAPGGRFPPAGSGAGLRRARTCRSAGQRRAGAGKTRVAFPDTAQRGNPFPRTRQSFPAGRRSESFFGTLLTCHPLGNPFAFEVWLAGSSAVGGWHGGDVRPQDQSSPAACPRQGSSQARHSGSSSLRSSGFSGSRLSSQPKPTQDHR